MIIEYIFSPFKLQYDNKQTTIQYNNTFQGSPRISEIKSPDFSRIFQHWREVEMTYQPLKRYGFYF